MRWLYLDINLNSSFVICVVLLPEAQISQPSFFFCHLLICNNLSLVLMEVLKDYNLNKVFVRDILAEDEEEFNNFFKSICDKYFLFGQNKKRSAICRFRQQTEAKDFIEKYNKTKLFNSYIKCEYALKKKSERKILAPFMYSNRKIIINNCIDITINHDFEIADIFHFLKDIYLKHIDAIIDCLREDEKETNKKETPNEEEKKEGEEESFHIVKGRREATFEKLIVTITKKNEDKKKEKKGKEVCIIYTVEFINLNLARLYSKWINVESFEQFLKKENKKLEKELEFVSSLCILSRAQKNVIVKNLSKSCNIDNIKKLFRKIERNVRVHIPMKNGKKVPYAFVEFHTKEQVEAALHFNGTKLCGNVITVERAQGAADIRSETSNHSENKNNEKNNEECGDEENVEAEDSRNNEEGQKEDVMSVASTGTTQRKNEYDVDEGKTLFITNLPCDTTMDELIKYVKSQISPYYVYIRICKKNELKASAFVKLKNKKDADDFLKKIGEYEEKKTDTQIEETENVIKKFALLRQQKKERKETIKNILLHDISKIKPEYLLFKNTYLVIKRAVRKEILLNDNGDVIGNKSQKKKLRVEKSKLKNNIHLLNDNDVNKEYLNEILKKRNLKLFEKKKKLLHNTNYVINPCRIYVRNYPLNLAQNEFRKLLFKHFTPLFMKKYNMKKKEAFKKSNLMIQKMLVLKKDPNNEAKHDKDVVKATNNKSTICFIDTDSHEHAKDIINFLQNRNIYELCDNILYKREESKHISTNEKVQMKKKEQRKIKTEKEKKSSYKNRDVLYVDYCIEDVRMLHIKQLREEKFLKHIEERKKFDICESANEEKTKKNIQKKKEKKVSRGRRQREKRRLQKLQQLQKEQKTNDISSFIKQPSEKSETPLKKKAGIRKKVTKKVEHEESSKQIKQGVKRKRDNDEKKKKKIILIHPKKSG